MRFGDAAVPIALAREAIRYNGACRISRVAIDLSGGTTEEFGCVIVGQPVECVFRYRVAHWDKSIRDYLGSPEGAVQ